MRTVPRPGEDEIRTDADAAARATLLSAPHMLALERYRDAVEARFDATPHADPCDGGDRADLLVLLETPGPRGPSPRFVSVDNATGTARNLRGFLRRAGINRRRILVWNAVPWIIHAPGALNRPPRRSEVAAGLALLPELLPMVAGLRGVVTAGRVAACAVPLLQSARPGLPVLAMPHPSPTYVCTSPAVPARILSTLRAAAAWLEPVSAQGR